MTYQEIINLILSKGFEEAEIYAQTNETSELSLFEGNVDSFNIKKIKGVTIRASKDGKTAYAYTESLEEKDLADVILKLTENVKNLSSTEPDFIFDGQAEYEKAPAYKTDAKEHSMEEKIALLQEVEKKCLAYDNRIFNVEVSYEEEKEEVFIVNSKGVDLSKTDEVMVLIVMVNAKGEDEVKVDYTFKATRSFKEFNVDEIVEKVCKQALDALGASFVQTSTYPVVLSTKVATPLLSAFSQTFSGVSALKKTTILASKLGEKVFGDNITLIDDPMHDKAFTKITFDDEGVPCKKVPVVEDGVFKSFIHSQKTANFFHVEPTGNGFKAGATYSVKPRFLALKEGNKSKEEIFEAIENGIYVTSVAGLHSGLNVSSGDFNLQSTGFKIVNGKLAEAITLFVISGNFFEMMKNIEQIGNDIEEGHTGRVACPTIHIKSLKVSGK